MPAPKLSLIQYCLLVSLLTIGVVYFMAAPAQAQPGAGPVILTNPLGAGVTITTILTRVINTLLGLVGFLAMLALVWGSIRFITSFGDEKKLTSAKNIIMWAVIGLALAVASFAIVQLVIKDILGVP